MKRPEVPRLSREQLRDWLSLEDAKTRRIALELRRMILRVTPGVAEGMKFHCPC